MATKASKINVKAFNALKDEIAQVYDGVIKLDQKLNGEMVKKFYDLARGVNLFANSLRQLVGIADVDLPKGLARVRQMFDEAARLGQSVSSIQNIDGTPLIKFANSLYRFMLAIHDAGDIDLSANPLLKVSTAIKQMVEATKETRSLTISITKFNNTVQAIQDFTKIASGFNKRAIQDLENLDAFTKKFLQTAQSLSIQATGSINITNLEFVLKDFGALFTLFKNTFSNVTPTMASSQTVLQSFSDFKKFIGGAISFTKALTGLKVALPSQIADFIDVIKLYTVLYDTFNRTLSGAVVTSGVSAKGTKTALTGFEVFKDFLKGAISFARGLSQVKLDPAQIAPLSGIFTSLINLYNSFGTSFSSATPFDAAALAKNFEGFSTIIKAVLGILKKLPTKSLNLTSLKNIEGAFTQIIGFYRNFGVLVAQQANDSTASLTASMLRGLGALVEGLGNFFASRASKSFLGSLADILSFRLALGQTVNAMKSIINIVDGMDTSRVEAVGAFAKGAGEIFTGLASFFKILTEGNLFSFRLPQLIGRIIQIRLALIPIGMTLNVLRPIFKAANKGDVSQVANFTAAVGSIFTALTGLFDLFSRRESKASFGTILKVWLGLKTVLSPVTNVINQLKKIPRGVNFESVAHVFEIIGKLSSPEGMANFGKLNDIDLSGLKNAGKQIASLIASFNGLDDKAVERVKAIGKLVDILPQLERLKEIGGIGGGSGIVSALSGIKTVSEQVAEGVKSAVVQLGLFYAGFQVLRTLGSLLNPIAIIGYFDRIGQAVNSVLFKLYDATKRIQEFGVNIREFGNTLVANFGIGNIVNSPLFDTAVEFDRLGTSLEVFGGLTKEQRKEAEAFANLLGKDYPLSANEAMKATLDLIKAGQSIGSAQSILPAAADLASLSDSGSIEQATSFIIQANAAFKQFNDTTAAGFENSAVAVDILAAAADSSTASVEGLAEGLSNVGPVASQFGLTLEETTAILALFTDGGISGAEAGTQLKSFLTNLTTKEAQKELRRLGVSVTDTAGNFRSMNDILNDIQESFTSQTVTFRRSSKLSTEQNQQLLTAQKALAAATRQQYLLENDLSGTALGKNADKKLAEAKTIAENATAIITELTGSAAETELITATIRRTEIANAESLKKIAGSYGQSGLAILLSQGEDGLKSFIAQMREVEPASVRARKALDNISGDIIQLQGSVETLGTKALAPLLEKFFRPFVQFSRFVVDAVLAMDESVIDFIATAGVLGAALATVVGGLAIVTGSIIQFGGALLSALAFIATPTGIPMLALSFLGSLVGFATGVAALAASFALLLPVITVVTTGFNTFSKIFNEDLGGAATQMQHFAERVGGALSQMGSALGEILGFVVELVSGGEIASLQDVGAGIASFFNSLSLQVTRFQTSGFGKTLTDLGQIFGAFTKALTFDTGAQKAADEVLAAASDFENLGSEQRNARAAEKARQQFVDNYSQFLLDMVKNNRILKGILGENLTLDGVRKFLDTAVLYTDLIRKGIGNVLNSFGDAFSSAQQVLKEGGGLGNALGTFVSELGKNLDSSLGDLAGTVLRAIGALFNLNTTDLSRVFDEKGFAAGISTVVQAALAEAGRQILANRGGIVDALTGIFDFFIVGGLNQAVALFRTIGAAGIADLVEGIANTLRDGFRGIVNTVFNLLEGNSIRDALLKAFGPGIEPILNLVESLGQMASLVGKIISNIVNAFRPVQTDQVQKEGGGFIDTLNNIIGGITNFINGINTVLGSIASSINLGGFVKTVGNIISSVADAIGNFLSGIFTPRDTRFDVSSVVKPAATSVQSIFEGIFNSIVETVQKFDLGKLVGEFFARIPEAIKGLDNLLGDAAGLVLDAIGDIFNIKDSFLEATFRGGGLLKGLRSIFTRLVRNIGGFLAENGTKIRDGFVSFFTGAFQGLFNLGGEITKALGLGDLSKAFGGIAEKIPAFFESLFGFIFDVLGGKDLATAMLDTFGPGIQPILDFVTLLQGAADTLVAVGQQIIDALFKPATPGGEPPIVVFLRSIGDAANSVVTFLQTQVLAPLAAGDAGLALSNLAQGVLNLVTGIASAVKAEIDRLDLPTIFKDVATSLLKGIGGALSSGVESLGDTLGFDATAFTNNIDTTIASAVDALASGDAENLFVAAAGAVINLLLTAIGVGAASLGSLVGFDTTEFLATLDQLIASNLSLVATDGGLLPLFANTISGLVIAAITGVFDGLANLLNIDTTTVSENLRNALSQITDAFTALTGGDDGTSIIDDAITIIGKIVQGIRDLIGVFTGGNVTTATTNAQGLAGPIQILVNIFSGIVSTTVKTIADIAVGLNDFIEALAKMTPAQIALTAGAIGLIINQFAGVGLAGLVTIVASGFSAIAGGIGTLFSILSTGKIGLMFLFNNSISMLANTFLAKAAALVVMVQFFRSIAQNITSFTDAITAFTEGDLAGAFGSALKGLINVFTDLGFNLLELLGIDNFFGITREEFHKFGEMVVFVVENAMRRAGLLIKTELIDPIANFVNLSLPLLLSGLEKARLQVKAGLGDTQAGLVLGIFDNIDALTNNGIDFAATTEAQLAGLAEDIAKGGQAAEDRLKGTVGLNFQKFYDSALSQFLALPDDPALKAEFARKVAGFFDLAGVNDDALAVAAASGDNEFFAAIVQGMLSRGIEVTPEMQKQFAESLIATFNVLDPAAAQNSLTQLDMTIAALAALELDTTYLEEQRALLQAQIDAFLATGTNPDGTTGTSVTTDVTVTPNVTTTPPLPEDDPLNPNSPNYVGKMLVKDEAGVVVPLDINLQPNWKNLEAADADQIVPTIQEAAQAAVDTIPAATPLVTFDSSSLTDPTKVEEFNTLIGTLITNIQTLGTELGGVAGSTLPVTTALTEISTAVTLFRDVNTPLFTEVGTAAGTIGNAIRDIQSALLIMFATATINFPIFALTASAAIGTIIFNFTLLKIAADTSLQSVVTKVRELATAFKDASLAAATLSNSPAFAAAGGGSGAPTPGTVGPGRAVGGLVRPGLLYPFLEKSQPELLQMGSQTFLAVPKSGNVVPMTDISSSRSTGLYGSAPAGRAGGSAGGAGTTILIQQGDTTINIHGVDPTDARAIGVAIRREMGLVNNTSTNRLSEKLRTANR